MTLPEMIFLICGVGTTLAIGYVLYRNRTPKGIAAADYRRRKDEDEQRRLNEEEAQRQREREIRQQGKNIKLARGLRRLVAVVLIIAFVIAAIVDLVLAAGLKDGSGAIAAAIVMLVLAWQVLVHFERSDSISEQFEDHPFAALLAYTWGALVGAFAAGWYPIFRIDVWDLHVLAYSGIALAIWLVPIGLAIAVFLLLRWIARGFY